MARAAPLWPRAATAAGSGEDSQARPARRSTSRLLSRRVACGVYRAQQLPPCATWGHAMRAATPACLLLLMGLAAAGDAPRAALASGGAASDSRPLASAAGLLDHVPTMPGRPALDGASGTYAGYLDVPALEGASSTQRALFYVLQMSASNPEKDPLVLWLKCVRIFAAKSQPRLRNMLTRDVLPPCPRRATVADLDAALSAVVF